MASLKRKSVWLIATGIAAGFAQPAMAQAPETDALTEAAPDQPENTGVADIVVTAQRRSESIQDIGISVSAFGEERLRDLGLAASTEIANMTPGVSLSSTSGGQYVQFAVRGVAQADFARHTESPNAVYVDDVYLASTNAQNFGMFDMDRVEVLRGPQGTLFGRNATGGLVHYITNDPTDYLDGFADVTYGRFNHVRLEGAIGGPLGGNFSGRVAVLREARDAFIKNIFPVGQITNPVTGVPMGPTSDVDDLRDLGQTAVRAKLLWRNGPSELMLSGVLSREKRSPGDFQFLGSAPVLDSSGRHVDSLHPRNNPNRCEAVSAETGQCLPLALVDFEVPVGAPGFPPGAFPVEDAVRPDQYGDLLGGLDPSNEGRRRAVSHDHSPSESNRHEITGGFYRFTHEFDFATLVAQGAYMEYSQVLTLDDGTPVPWTVVDIQADHKSVSQELRLSGASDRLQWTAGVFYLKIDADTVNGLSWPKESPITAMFGPLVTGVPGLPWDSPAFADIRTNSYSAFGQVDWGVADTVTLVLGGRLVRENKDYSYRNPILRNDNPARVDPLENALPVPTYDPVTNPLGAYPPFTGELDKTLWMGKAQVEYRPNSDALLYVGVSRGVKAGGFNAKLNDFSPPLAPEDIPYDDETLISYEGGGKFDVAEGRLRVNSSVFYYDYNDYQAYQFTGVGGNIANADARYYGGEVEVAARPTPNIDLALNASYLNAKVKDVAVAEGVRRDVRPAYTPKYSIAGFVRYRLPTPVLNGNFALQLDGSYRGKSSANLRNFQAEELDAYGQLNGSLSWTDATSGISLTGFVRNILDDRYETSVVDISTLCGCAQISYSDPRTWGLRLHVPIR